MLVEFCFSQKDRAALCPESQDYEVLFSHENLKTLYLRLLMTVRKGGGQSYWRY